jgi:hypothetical protein
MADYSQNQNRPPLPKTIFDEMKLRLSGPLQEGASRPPSLRVKVIRNNPRIDVFTNIPNDKDGGRISAPMEAATMFALLERLRQHVDGEPSQQTKIENKTGMPGQQVTLSTTVIGKDQEGRVFISIIAEDRPRIKFVFLPSAWHTFAHKDGSPYNEAELSCVYAKGWVRLMELLITNVMDNYFELSPYQQQQQSALAEAKDETSETVLRDATKYDEKLPF